MKKASPPFFCLLLTAGQTLKTRPVQEGFKKKKMTQTCRQCGKPVQLTPSKRRSHNYICNRCANAQRDADPARYLARKMADRLRRKGVARPYPGVGFVRRVLQRSPLPSGANVRHFNVVFCPANAGLMLENAHLISSTECSVQSRRGTCL